MKKRSLYLGLVALMVLTAGAVVYKYQDKKSSNKDHVYELLERKGASNSSAEFKDIKARFSSLKKVVEFDKTDTKSVLKLAAMYIEEARVTGNHMYYDMAALDLVERVLAIDPANFHALVFKSLVLLSQHHFAEAITIAEEAKSINPSNAYVYGLLTDGNVEMGNYDAAVAHADKMNALRPDLTSYSRVSYLREIFGDYAGAIQAMKMAVETGGRGDEHTEWTRVQLAQLYEKTGDYKTADTLYKLSLALRTDYPYALAGEARVAMAAGDYKTAIAFFEKADQLVDDYSMKEELVDLYMITGDKKRSEEIANEVIDKLIKESQAANEDENAGHYNDRELAFAYLKLGKTSEALKHATLEYNRRPENIDVNEMMAWVLYSSGDHAKALPYIKAALKTNSKNPVLLSRASLILYKTGDKQLAKTLLEQANASHSYVGQTLKNETAQLLQNM